MMGKYEGLQVKVFERAKELGFNYNKLEKEYGYFCEIYPNLSLATYKFMAYEICNNKNKEMYFNNFEDINKQTYAGFRDILEELAKELNYNTFELYKLFSDFVEKYPTMKYSTYTRRVREVCQKKKYKNIGNDTVGEITQAVLERIAKENVQNVDIIKYINDSLSDDKVKFYKEIDRIKFQKETKGNSFKRMVVLSDLHCGHILGLTPPSWHYQYDNIELGHIADMQNEAWKWYTNAIKRVGKDVDILVINGDLIDGRGDKSGSTELITSDRARQVSIGVECIQQWDAKQIFMTRGTPYHTGKYEQFEDLAAEKLGAYIDNSLDIKVNGKMFNFKHKVAGSTVPYGKSTAVIKEAFWNLVQSAYNEVPFADVVIRSHVHYMMINQDSMRYSITTPALQLNSRYGQQQCTGLNDFGFLVIDIYDNGHILINPCVAKLEMDIKKNIIEL
jgi:hypothetical protein